jgi:hemerythrin
MEGTPGPRHPGAVVGSGHTMGRRPRGGFAVVTGRVQWNDRLTTGVGAVDAAHRELVDLHNRIVSASEQEVSVSRVRERIRTFLLYARWHFHEEEEYMRRIRYPGYVDHKADHNRLLDDAGDFVTSLGAALTREDGPAIVSYFNFWLTRHMTEKDRALRDYLADTGAASRG